ncbi:MAG: DUF362 domain-containing protein [Candidatus Aenigmarchaeota archaeon]|nr:DUF362 domain-containing protein [Candidatus Aenigmarchaeota archaeon]
MKTKVSIWKGEDRYENTTNCLDEIKEKLKEKIKGKERIIIKPNFVSDINQFASTHVDAVRAVLDFVSKHTDQKLLIAEGSAYDTFKAFKNFGYLSLKKEYNIDFFDLNKDDYVTVSGFDSELKPMELRISKTVVESDCRISVCPMKTHNEVVVTLSLKNLAVGSLLKNQYFPASKYVGFALKRLPVSAKYKNYKAAIHQGTVAINKNIFEIAKKISPDISVIDAFKAMEGEGPGHGDPVMMKLALAGTDFLATDTIATRIMGFNPENIGYFHYCKQARLGIGNNKDIETVGNAGIENVKKKFKPHSTYEQQLKWR